MVQAHANARDLTIKMDNSKRKNERNKKRTNIIQTK